jgi:cell division protein ZapA
LYVVGVEEVIFHKGAAVEPIGKMESPKNSVRVNICGEEYTVRSEGDVEYIREVAQFVDRKMQEVADKTANKSPARMAILTALNIADELFREREKGEHGLTALEQRANNIISLLNEKIPESAT